MRTNEKQTTDSVFKGFPPPHLCKLLFNPSIIFLCTALINVNQIKVRKTLSAFINFGECVCFEESVSEALAP